MVSLENKEVRAKLTDKHPKTGIRVTGEEIDAIIVDEYRTLSWSNPVLQTLVSDHPEWVDVENPPNEDEDEDDIEDVDYIDLKVSEQQEILEDLTTEELQDLHERETRVTAKRNIKQELQRQA